MRHDSDFSMFSVFDFQFSRSIDAKVLAVLARLVYIITSKDLSNSYHAICIITL